MGPLVLPCSLLVVLLLDPAALGQNRMNQTHPAYTGKEGSTTAVSGNFSVASSVAGNAVSTSQVRSAATTSQGTGLTPSRTPNLAVSAADPFTETSTVAVFHDSSTSLAFNRRCVNVTGRTSSSTSQEATYPEATPSPEAETPATASHTSAPAQASGSPATPAEGRPPTLAPADGPPHTHADVQPTQPHDSSLTMVAFGTMSFILILIVITAILVTTVNLKGRCGTVKENGKTNSDSVVSESNANGEKESITLVSIKTINAETGSDRASSAPGTRFDVGDRKLRQDLPNTKLV